jgi:hypothetical protein
MHAERVRRKEAEDRARELESKVTKAEERLATINDLMEKASRGDPYYDQQAPIDPNADIDPERDIFGAVLQLRERNAALIRQQEQRQAADQYRADILSFKAKTPDFLDAHQHLVKSRDAELEAMGMTDPAQRQAHLQQEQRGLILSALQSGKSPSALMYQLAQGRGYRGSGARGQQTLSPPSSPSVQQIQNLQSNVQANASLSGAGGSPGGEMTMERLVNMSDEDFAEIVGKMGGLQSHKIKQAFGGGSR